MMKHTYSPERVTALKTPADPSKYICSIDQVAPRSRAVSYARESSQTQKDNLPHQVNNLKMETEKCGHKVIAEFKQVVYGWDIENQTALEWAILKAKAAGAFVVAESVDRFRRCWRYRKTDKMLPLNVFEMKQLMAEADGVQLVTLLHPDTPPNEVRRYQTKRGQAGKGNYGGRPVTKLSPRERRIAQMPEALNLRKAGRSWREIAHQLKVPCTTIRDWVKRRENPHTFPPTANQQ
jgi:predicted site-specific integrase-resolvase